MSLEAGGGLCRWEREGGKGQGRYPAFGSDGGRCWGPRDAEDLWTLENARASGTFS